MKRPTWFPETVASFPETVATRTVRIAADGRGVRRRAAGKGRHSRRPRPGFRPDVPAPVVVGVAAAVVIAGGIFALSGSDGDAANDEAVAASVREVPGDPGVALAPGGELSGFIPPASPSASPSAAPSTSPGTTAGAPTGTRTSTAAASTPTSRHKERTAQPAAERTKDGGGGKATGQAARFAEQIAELVNVERAKAGCAPLRVSAQVQAAAQAHADDMAARDYYEHASPEGRHADDRMRAAGYPAGKWGENIHRGPDDPATAMIDWMNSPGHRDNILDCGFTDFGVGVNLSANGPWWVQNFGTRY
ncbi:CAP domain-containing protein [Streptomyces sp. NPDC054841]